MEKAFDCVVGKLTLPEKELQWMSAMWAGIELSELKSSRPNHKTVSSDFDQLLFSKGRTTRSKAKESAREEDESGIGTQETLHEESLPGEAGDGNQGTGTTRQEGVGEEHVKTRPVKLVFGLPASMGEAIREKISHFSFEFAAEEVKKIWKCCREVGNPAEFTEEEMEAFHRSVDN